MSNLRFLKQLLGEEEELQTLMEPMTMRQADPMFDMPLEQVLDTPVMDVNDPFSWTVDQLAQTRLPSKPTDAETSSTLGLQKGSALRDTPLLAFDEMASSLEGKIAASSARKRELRALMEEDFVKANSKMRQSGDEVLTSLAMTLIPAALGYGLAGQKGLDAGALLGAKGTQLYEQNLEGEHLQETVLPAKARYTMAEKEIADNSDAKFSLDFAKLQNASLQNALKEQDRQADNARGDRRLEIQEKQGGARAEIAQGNLQLRQQELQTARMRANIAQDKHEQEVRLQKSGHSKTELDALAKEAGTLEAFEKDLDIAKSRITDLVSKTDPSLFTDAPIDPTTGELSIEKLTDMWQNQAAAAFSDFNVLNQVQREMIEAGNQIRKGLYGASFTASEQKLWDAMFTPNAALTRGSVQAGLHLLEQAKQRAAQKATARRSLIIDAYGRIGPEPGKTVEQKQAVELSPTIEAPQSNQRPTKDEFREALALIRSKRQAQ